MKSVYLIADNLVTPLGIGSEVNYNAVKSGKSSVSQHSELSIDDRPFWASLFTDEIRNEIQSFSNSDATFFEKLCCICISGALSKVNFDFNSSNTVFILSTTKGNIELIDTPSDERIRLGKTADRITEMLGISATSIVVSSACISGVAALITAKRLIESGKYEHAIVCGADLITDFVAKGFQSLRATADRLCQPYDEKRNGINLGEAAGAVILSASPQGEIELREGFLTNDSNHISGPSKTGEELAWAVKRAVYESGISATDLAFVSAHGTATVYNDEMESKAFEIAGLSSIPVNSLKPHFGHTLGAAGVIESVISSYSALDSYILPTMRFEKKGVSGHVEICAKGLILNRKYFIKTASGFGGCNAALVFEKK